ncbi:ATPase, partial [Streptomyces sp. SID2131]|nr:ATPase [Streptomyces sp. SID2131]
MPVPETIAKPGDGAETDTAPGRPQTSTEVLRPHAEHAFAAELAALAAADDRPRPAR